MIGELARSRRSVSGVDAQLGRVSIRPLWAVAGGYLVLFHRGTRVPMADELCDRLRYPRGSLYLRHPDDPGAGWTLRTVGDDAADQLADRTFGRADPVSIAGPMNQTNAGDWKILEAVALYARFGGSVRLTWTDARRRRVDSVVHVLGVGAGTGETVDVVDAKSGRAAIVQLSSLEELDPGATGPRPAFDPFDGDYSMIHANRPHRWASSDPFSPWIGAWVPA